MIQVYPINTEHTLLLIGRYDTSKAIVLVLYNEATQEETTPASTYELLNGIMSVTFDFAFVENDKYQVKISDVDGIIYRGKLIATSQQPQEFKQTNELYYYE